MDTSAPRIMRSLYSFRSPSPFQRQQAILHLAGLERPVVERMMGANILRAAMWRWSGEHDELNADEEDDPSSIQVRSTDSTLSFHLRRNQKGLSVQRVERMGNTELVLYLLFPTLEHLRSYCDLDRLVTRDPVLRHALLARGDEAFASQPHDA